MPDCIGSSLLKHSERADDDRSTFSNSTGRALGFDVPVKLSTAAIVEIPKALAMLVLNELTVE